MAFKNALLILAILAVIVLIPSEVLARDLPAKGCTPGTVYKIEGIRQIAGPVGLGKDVNDLDGGNYNIQCRNLCCVQGFTSFVEFMSGLYNQISSPASQRANSPNINMRSNFDVDSHYLTELLQEHQKLGPFMQVLPLCSRLLNQEILRVSGKNGMLQNQVGFSDFDRMQYVSPSHMVSSEITPNFTGWNSLSHDRLSGVQGLNVDWQTSPQAVPNSHIVKKILRLDIPKEGYPNEELLRGRPGYEHLNDPLHILIEAELPASVVDVRLRQAQEIIQELLKPVDESQDFYKRQQLRELAMLNSNFREESPQLSGSASPFTSNEIKRAKTDQ
ncbi:hypothetical protein Ahy_A01g004215 isoform A [Arachis hypogaea]|uniref:STAR protein homodimerisation region domain-containing protein n=1 Tax=Arachis hypogaea TaxID=3818 RepID=A0A445EV64_ARAHY|nr:hypothetical protein Ahy_A01g004215 isoform A [Arachis hypogaea]